ncbi:diaminopimelate epimerase [Muribaculaceae bacterium Isolate-039 (Harlan)]|uniref:Diaminopimelate epimerase n=1 Tax=Duncaniella muris TaxID=2094150 RepID=A0A2V1IQN0_9BACT|nr:diaminopimelate epimerase [Muribaculaceae bacterium S4]NBI20267.1 diaminopimelate epimerase [Muribaculaceae bacterium Z1]PWB03491.1 diaminopimelate epimerase [Duncaniella muris]QCD40753.1 diaminopimelate epimerase [Duncaniella sp. C9]QCP73805.1 diaminopimelate epimerase [Duncaniella sp. B8]ROS91578.1 diaminopimelate epimerase [Muribaculaceae bacterium Isolate-039 (Harlan)]
MSFTKMHGIGNDYIYINCMESVPDRLPELAEEMSDRHFGVGGDGIVLICPSDKADFRMRMFNNDGSEARMCGNASRCIAKYVHDHKLTDKTCISLETLSGIKVLSLNMSPSGEVESVTVDMGEPELNAGLVPVRSTTEKMVEEPVATSCGEVRVTAVSMGNPHGVVFVDRIEDVPFETLGPELEKHSMWPDRANIEFLQIISPSEARMRVWERGTGETLACGTGACASAVAAALTGRCGREVTIHLRGGDLHIRWANNGHVMMTGGATEVFEGNYYRQR